VSEDTNLRVVRDCGLFDEDVGLWYKKYHGHKYHAMQRGLKSFLTFKNYMVKVVEAGLSRPDQIGARGEQYQLGRIGDTGDYTIDNCRFITSRQNILEAFSNKRHLDSIEQKAKLRRGQTKETCEAVAKQAASLSRTLSKEFVVFDPDGNRYTGRDISEFSKQHGLYHGGLHAVCRGERRSCRGWTGSYTDDSNG
jgi:hypothetical protein